MSRGTLARTSADPRPIWPTCKPDLCPESSRLAAACSRLQDTHELERLYVGAAGNVRSFLAAMQNLTAPYKISAVARMHADFVLPTPELDENGGAEGHSHRVTIGVVGDSLDRELFESIQEIAPWAHVRLWQTGLTSFRKVPYKADRVKLPGAPFAAIEALEECAVDAIFIGGFSGPWKLNRKMRQVKPGSPYTVHAADAGFELDRLDCLARHASLPVTYVGGVVLDVDGFTLFNGGLYSTFEELALPNTWSRVEQNLEATRDYSDNLHFLHTSRLHLDCPGVRCDGMHYGKAGRGDCQPTKSVWFPLVANKLLALGLTNGTMIRSRRRDCHARRHERRAAAAADPNATSATVLQTADARHIAPHTSTLLHRCLLANLKATPFKTSDHEQLAANTAQDAAAADNQSRVTDLETWQRIQVGNAVSEAI